MYFLFLRFVTWGKALNKFLYFINQIGNNFINGNDVMVTMK